VNYYKKNDKLQVLFFMFEVIFSSKFALNDNFSWFDPIFFI